jgi:serine/threonine-protein kinase
MELIAFETEDGSVRKMAIVRREAPRGDACARYRIGEKIGSGGMASVHLGRLVATSGVSRTVAVKRMHPFLAEEGRELVERFVDEARIAASVRHANVVPTLDVVANAHEILLVLEYVPGEALSRLRKLAREAGERVPPEIASAVVVGTLRGLHAAHEATGEDGAPLEIVHRDVSPQNILVGTDGVARVLDFGIAKATGRLHQTFSREIKGKLSYMAPEQVSGEELDRRCDLFAAGVILWELLAGERLFRRDDALATMDAIFHADAPPLASRIGVDPAVDEVLACALAKDASMRYVTAQEMARALEAALAPATDREVAEWVARIAGPALADRARLVAAFEAEDGADASGERLVPGGRDTTTAPLRADGDGLRRALAPPPLPEIVFGTVLALPPPDASIDDLLRAPLATLPELEGSTVSNDAHPIEYGARTLATPLVMVAPSLDELAAEDATRVGPIEQRRQGRTWAPIPFPFTPAARASGRAASVAKVALLVVLPPLVAALVILGVSARGPGERAAAAAPHAAEPLPPAASASVAASASAAPARRTFGGRHPGVRPGKR